MKDNLRSNLNLLPNEIVKKFNSSGIFNLPDNNKIPSNSEILEEILSFSKFKDLTKFFNLLSENTINSIKQLFEITQPNLTIDNLLYELCMFFIIFTKYIHIVKHKLTVVNTYQLILDNGDINESSKDPITTNNITSKRSIEISSDDDIVPQIPKKLKKKKNKEKEKEKKEDIYKDKRKRDSQILPQNKKSKKKWI